MKTGGTLAAEQTRELDLPAGRGQQVDAANDQVDALPRVVHGDRELIRPVAEPVANQHVAALLCRRLLLPAEQRILERLDTGRQAHAPADTVRERQVAIAACARILSARRWSPGRAPPAASERRVQSQA